MTKQEKIARYEKLNEQAQRGQVLFVGSSLMEMFPVEKLFREREIPIAVYNRGIGGFVIAELERALDVCVLDLAPRRIFINIGTNDLNEASLTMEELVRRYERVLDRIAEHLPSAEIYLMAYYPINEEAATEEMKPCLRVRTNARICEANAAVQQMAKRRGLRYIDVNDALKDEQGRLKAEYTIEGMHIREEGYRAILDDLIPYVLEPAW